MIQIEQLVVGAFEVNCCIVRASSAGAIVVDPGSDSDRIIGYLKENELTVAAYMLTHGHTDHICALAEVYDAFPAAIGLHPDDEAWAFAVDNQMLPFYPAPRRPAAIDRVLEDGQLWSDPGLTYHVISTPGHTPGSVCFYFEEEGVLICGDTLFRGSVGRTDLPGGDSRGLAKSLQKLAKLPDETKVHPGHGPDTTIAEEKRANYFMQSACCAGHQA